MGLFAAVRLRDLRFRIVDEPLRSREDGELIPVIYDDLAPPYPDAVIG